jgi:hypothetical protein
MNAPSRLITTALLTVGLGLGIALGQEASPAAPLVFEDVTAAWFSGDGVPPPGSVAHFQGLPDTLGTGLVVFDSDRDGRLDLFLPKASAAHGPTAGATQPGGRLFRQVAAGKFVDATRSSGLVSPPGVFGAAAADYDGDGHQDLVLTGMKGTVLYRNEGNGTFRDVTAAAGIQGPVWGTSPLFFDADGDGWLDLFLPSYIEYDPAYSIYFKPDAFPSASAYMPTQSRLYRNGGNGKFSDVTAQAGLDHPMRAMAALAADLDGDGKVDLYVPCDGMESQVFRNLGGGKFQRLGFETGLWYGQKGEGAGFHAAALWNDGGREGVPGLFVTDETFCGLFQPGRSWRWEDATVSGGAAEALGMSPSWGCVVADLDADGFEDLYVSRGAFRHPQPTDARLLHGQPGGRFSDVSLAAGAALAAKTLGRACVAADLDGNGQLDLVETALDLPVRLLANRCPAPGRNLRLRLRGKAGSHSAIGARVRVTAGGRAIERQVAAGGYLGWSEGDLFVGVGQADTLERIEISWPSGVKQNIDLKTVPATPVEVTEP